MRCLKSPICHTCSPSRQRSELIRLRPTQISGSGLGAVESAAPPPRPRVNANSVDQWTHLCHVMRSRQHPAAPRRLRCRSPCRPWPSSERSRRPLPVAGRPSYSRRPRHPRPPSTPSTAIVDLGIRPLPGPRRPPWRRWRLPMAGIPSC